LVVTWRPAAVTGCGCRSRAARLSVPERRRGRKWGGQYTWEINNWAGAAGSALNITATSGSTFKILVTSLTGSNTAGAVPGFVGTTGTSFTIATSSPAMTGFDKSTFTTDSATAFGNVNTLPTNAGFWLSTNGGSTSLILNYAPSATARRDRRPPFGSRRIREARRTGTAATRRQAGT
jgi:hypothetical protein